MSTVIAQISLSQPRNAGRLLVEALQGHVKFESLPKDDQATLSELVHKILYMTGVVHEMDLRHKINGMCTYAMRRNEDPIFAANKILGEDLYPYEDQLLKVALTAGSSEMIVRKYVHYNELDGTEKRLETVTAIANRVDAIMKDLEETDKKFDAYAKRNTEPVVFAEKWHNARGKVWENGVHKAIKTAREFRDSYYLEIGKTEIFAKIREEHNARIENKTKKLKKEFVYSAGETAKPSPAPVIEKTAEEILIAIQENEAADLVTLEKTIAEKHNIVERLELIALDLAEQDINAQTNLATTSAALIEMFDARAETMKDMRRFGHTGETAENAELIANETKKAWDCIEASPSTPDYPLAPKLAAEPLNTADIDTYLASDDESVKTLAKAILRQRKEIAPLRHTLATVTAHEELLDKHIEAMNEKISANMKTGAAVDKTLADMGVQQAALILECEDMKKHFLDSLSARETRTTEKPAASRAFVMA